MCSNLMGSRILTYSELFSNHMQLGSLMAYIFTYIIQFKCMFKIRRLNHYIWYQLKKSIILNYASKFKV